MDPLVLTHSHICVVVTGVQTKTRQTSEPLGLPFPAFGSVEPKSAETPDGPKSDSADSFHPNPLGVQILPEDKDP